MRQQGIAHVRKMPEGVWIEHALLDHLKEVSRIAGQFAEGFGGKDWASLAGLWHDLGKYSARFQRYISDVSGYEQ
jgi:CRISPR-associated endonuclease/helicase Cas3